MGIIRREQTGDDPHPIKLSSEDEDFGVAQARRANVLLDSPGFSAVIVATNGTLARMNTVHPATFITFKRWMAEQDDRDPLKRRQDVLAFGLSVANPAQFFEGTWQGNPN